MKSLADLEQIREKTLDEIILRKNKDGFKIVVGMGTCGIAAGARPVMNSFLVELKNRSINNVNVIMTGCMGVCRLEPIVEVIDTEGNKVTYVNVTHEKAARIVDEHIVNGKVCADLTIGAADSK